MADQNNTQSDREWHLDKRVPIALILALLLQFSGAAWLASAAFKDIEANRSGIVALQKRVTPLERSGNSQAIQLGRIEEQVSGLREDMGRLLRIIEQRMNDR